MTLRLALTPKEAADLLGLSVESIYRAVKKGQIPSDRVSGRIVIPAAALVARFGEPVDVEAA